MTTLNTQPTRTHTHRVLDAIGNTPLVALRSIVGVRVGSEYEMI